MGHRDQLLAAARHLLQDKGYAHITARDLVAASGTNLALIGYHFGSKAGRLNARRTAVASFVLAACDGLALQWIIDPARSPNPEDLLRGLDDLLSRDR